VTVRTYPNQNPWITGNIRTELKARAAAFKERDSNPEVYKKSCNALRQTIKKAKPQYRTKIKLYYTGSEARRMWQCLQTISDYKGKHSRELPSDTSLPDELNYFYARFEANNTETCTYVNVLFQFFNLLFNLLFLLCHYVVLCVDNQGHQPPKPLPVHNATIQKVRSVQVHQSWG
jgi:hypothetical protein